MLLMTKEIEKKLPALHSQEEKAPGEVPIVVKFFDPTGSWTWYVTEGEKEENGDFLFFGLVYSGVGGFEKEFGYFKLSELQGAKQSLVGLKGLPIERDMHFTGTLADVMAGA